MKAKNRARMKPAEQVEGELTGMSGPASPPNRRQTLVGLALIALAVCVTYGNTLQNEFIHDDKAEILQNPYVRDFVYLPKIFTTPAWAFGSEGPYQFSSNYYRPIQYLTYSFLYHLVGPSPWGYHLYKLLTHFAVCGLFFWIVWCCWQNYPLALCSALLFAVHPGNTEAVSWVSAITDTNCTLFFLLSLLVYLRDRSQPSTRNVVLMSFFFLVGLLSKETTVSLLGLILLWDWLASGQFPAIRKQARVVVPLLAVFAVYLFLRIHAIGAFLDRQHIRFEFLNGFQVFLNQIYLLAQYTRLFFFPVSLNAHHFFEPLTSPWSRPFAFAVFGLAGVGFLFCSIARRLEPTGRRIVLVGGAWFVVTLLPVLIFLKRIGENLFAERYFYLPCLGLCLSAAFLVTHLKMRLPRLIPVLFALLLSLLSWRAIDRNRVWRNELVFYETTVQASPKAPVILNSLGAVYFKQGRYEEAIRIFETSISSRVTIPALKNLAYAYFKVGRFEDSVTSYKKAIATDPMDAGAYSALGDVLRARGMNAEAIQNYEKALALYPESTVALFKYAEACLADRRYEQAIRALKSVLNLRPSESARAYRTLAKVYRAQNFPQLAEEAERKASAPAQVQLYR
ncbi:MAG: tetratricopeptide repeat protein [Acidobacteriota bacterium]